MLKVEVLPRFDCQLHGVELSDKHSRYGYWYPTGVGKTVMALDIIKKKQVPFLVCAPLPAIQAAWIADNEDPKFGPINLDTVEIWDRKMDERRKMLKEEHQIYIINPEGLKKLSDEIFQMCAYRKIAGIIYDESSGMRDPSSQMTKTMLRLSREVEYFYPMSGTPAHPKKLYEYFCQMKAIDPNLFGTNFTAFRNKYFTPGNSQEKLIRGRKIRIVFNWNITDEKQTELLAKIAKKSITVDKDACIDLPARTWPIRLIPMSTKPIHGQKHSQLKIYKDMMKHQVAEVGGAVVLAPQKVTALMKMRQICSGHMIDGTGETHHVSNNKLKFLKEELRSMGHEQCIIWVNFKWEANSIEEILGDKCVRLTGKESKKEKDHNIKVFKDQSIQYLIANPKSAKFALTFIKCCYAIYFSIPDSPEDYSQSQDRIYRAGQSRKCTFIHFCSVVPDDKKKTTVDQVGYYNQQNNTNLATDLKLMLMEWGGR